jgi:hypothetical protein
VGAFLAGLTRFAANCAGIGDGPTPTEEAIIHLPESTEQGFAEAGEDRHEMRKDLGWLNGKQLSPERNSPRGFSWPGAAPRML